MKHLIKFAIILTILTIGCASSGGGSGGNIAAPINQCGLDGLKAIWWVDDYDGSLNFINHSATVHYSPDSYWIYETFIIHWNCSVDESIDYDNHKIIHTFEYDSEWTLTDTQILTPECVCGG